jgi:predicted Zn finger-like uncharacterized protein
MRARREDKRTFDMKIVCGSCQAKYSIADEKVAGKVFKIRCKRCSEVIVVRGDQEEQDAGGHAAADASGDAIWHVVISGEQAGPFSPNQLAEMMTAGKLDWEAYVWTEGFENWLPMRDVPDLVTAISGPPESEPQAQPEPVRVAVGAPAYSAAQPSMGADPFADEGASGSVFGSSVAQPAARSNLFVASSSAAAENPFEAESRVVASAPSPRVSMEQAMTGARNENSVLFSLKNLQALATGSSAPSAAPAAAHAARPGFAGGEGSGLIDIRALATATGVNDQGKHGSEKDALLSLGSAQAGAFGALGSPMLTAPTRDDETSKKGLVIAIIGGFALLAVSGVTAALILRTPAAPPPQVATVVVAPPIAAPVAAPQPSAAAPNAAEPKSEGELAAERARAAPGAAAPAKGPAPLASGERGHTPAGAHREKSAEAEPVKSASAAKPEPAPSKPKGGSSSLDDLLDNAIGSKGGGAKSAAPAPAASNLPEKPTRDDVLAAMNGIKGDVSACAKGQTGVAFANITVAGKTGRVSNVEVTGMTGEVGSCIARTVRKASFPKFKSDNFQVKFPFRL